MAATRIFADLDLNFAAHPISKDVTRRYNENAVKAALKNLLQTSYYERPFHSEIGAPIRQLLFDVPGPMNREMIRRAIEDTVSNYEPRVELLTVEVKYDLDNNSVDILLEFRVLNSPNVTTLELTLDRTR
jgi:phage baseplate assembly protein W